MKKEVEFYNFPIELMQGVFSGETPRDKFLINILKFHIYKNHLGLPDSEFEETEKQRFLRCSDFWRCDIPAKILDGFHEDAETLYNSLEHSKVTTGINLKTFWEYYKMSKTDFEWRCLILFLALKSIISVGNYRKSTNDALFSRANGFATIEDYVNSGRFELKEFRRQKVITELELNWNLKYYSRQVRGFYFSFKLSLRELMQIAESKRTESKKKKLDNEKKNILQEIREQDL